MLNDRVIAGADQLSANLTLTVPLVVPQRWATWSHAADNVRTARAWLTVLAQRRSLETLTRALLAGMYAPVTLPLQREAAPRRGGLRSRRDRRRRRHPERPTHRRATRARRDPPRRAP